MSDVTYHLVPGEYYRDTDRQAPYTPEQFEAEGFIHCSNGVKNVVIAGNTHYKDDRRMYVVLVIETAKVVPEIVYEDGDTERIHPHIYGPLNRDAIVDIVPILRQPDGAFLPPPLPAP